MFSFVGQSHIDYHKKYEYFQLEMRRLKKYMKKIHDIDDDDFDRDEEEVEARMLLKRSEHQRNPHRKKGDDRYSHIKRYL